MPAKLLKLIEEFESRTGHRVRFRSFTLLRSPLSLAHSQFSYWHPASGFTRQVFYQLSPELLFWGDAFKLLSGKKGPRASWCLAREDGERAGGIFLDLPLQEESENLCNTRQWQVLCHQVVIARVAQLTKTLAPLNCSSKPLGDGLKETTLMETPCRTVWLQAWQETMCLIRHADSVQRTLAELGCGAIIRQAFDRLDQLSHVLFMDASHFSLKHAFEMATRGPSNATASSLRTNVGRSNVQFVDSEIEPFNWCSLRFCALPDEPMPHAVRVADMCCRCVFVDGQAFAKYSARVPYFDALRERELLKLPINKQVLLSAN
jgi:hypothetical protein